MTTAFARIAFIGYGAWLIVGGFYGFFISPSRSLISLIAGSVTGVLALVAAFLVTKNPVAGLALGLVTALIVAGSFVPRYLASPTRAFFPGGLTILLSALVLIVAVGALLGARATNAR